MQKQSMPKVHNSNDAEETADSKIQDLIKLTEEEANKAELSDQAKFLADQKIDVLRSIN